MKGETVKEVGGHRQAPWGGGWGWDIVGRDNKGDR